MKIKTHMKVLFLVALLIRATPVEATTALMFSSFNDDILAPVCEAVLKEAYGKLNISISFDRLPGNRALHLSNSGRYDGETYRIKGIESEYPNLIWIPVALYTVDSVVVTKTLDFKVNGWESLKPYKIGILRGVKYSEIGTRGMDRYIVSTYNELIHVLETNRVDLIVLERTVQSRLDDRQKKTLNILEPPIVTKPVYHYLHKNHRDLVPLVTHVLTTMKKDGTINQINQTLLPDNQ